MANENTFFTNSNAEYLAKKIKSIIGTTDTTLQGAIDAEATTREEADTTLQGAIDAEATARTGANNGYTSSITQLQAMITALQSKVASLTASETSETITEKVTESKAYSTEGVDYTISTTISGSGTTLTITNANSVTLTSDTTLSDDARLNITAEEVTLDGVTVSGSFNKSTSNATMSLNGCKYVTIKNMVFDDTYTAYNGYEIGLGSSDGDLPVSVIIDNCQFTGENSNNAINIFGTESNAVVTISNCYFKKVSNVLRLSNKTNATNVVMNVVNCTVDEWEDTAPCQGFLLCQDYTNTTSEEDTKEKNLFGPEKLTINFTNLVHAGEKVLPSNLADVCGTQDENQLIYVYWNVTGTVLAYDADLYPTITFS